ncbi:hypothetical protein V6N13_106418 [Hibiscus sabdariffa]
MCNLKESGGIGFRDLAKFNVINTNDADEIVSIPLPSSEQLDRLVWCGEYTWDNTVRSGYRILLLGPLINHNDRELYKKLWQSKCPSKVKIQCRKFIRNFVPTKVNLSVKRVTNDTRCVRCNHFPEDALHVI